MEFGGALEISPLAAVLLGAGVGFLAGLVGVGGGTFMVPSLVYLLNVPIRVAIGTDLLQILATAGSGAYRHFRQKTADPLLGAMILLGAVLGGQAGAHVNKLLPEQVVSDIFGVLVILVGVQFLLSHVIKKYERRALDAVKRELTHFRLLGHMPEWHLGDAHGVHQVSHLTLKRRFHGHEYTISIPKAVLVGLVVGFFSGLMGVGGGFLAVPLMVGVLGVPMHVAVGTSLVVVLGAAASGALVYLEEGLANPLLAAFLLAGGVPGAQAGAMASRRLPDITLRRIFGALMLIVGMKMLGVV